jgi:hypothetical protein
MDKNILSIPFGDEGKLTIVGRMGNLITLIASDILVLGLDKLQARVEYEFPTGKCLVTNGANNLAIIIFQHRVSKNSNCVAQLLGSLKRRLQLAIKRADEETLCEVVAISEATDAAAGVKG